MSAVSISVFSERLTEIFPVIMRELGRRQNDALYKGEVTLQQFILLTCLLDKGRAKMSELALFMGVSMPAMTGIVARLVRAGYAARESFPKDRRIILVHATAKGKELVRRIKLGRKKMIRDIFGLISETDREQYLRILTNVRDILLGRRKKRK